MNNFFIFFWVLNLVAAIMCIPFLTLLERKIISYAQNRKGPKKVSFLGLLQPVADGVKLIMKKSGHTSVSNTVFFFFSSFFSFFLMLMLWMIYPSLKKSVLMHLSMLLFLSMSAFKVYSILGSGWSSKSKYSLLGSLRGVAQTVSYEMKMIFLVLMPCTFFFTFSLSKMLNNKKMLFIFFSFMFIIWMFIFLVESKRTPFDFSEGESELVSGFKTEYSSLLFTFLFLSEYGKMIFFSFLTAVIFLPKMGLPIFGKLIVMVILWSRATFPRYRYDLLMSFSWTFILPVLVLTFLLTLI